MEDNEQWMSVNKKRNISNESSVFQRKRTNNYFFIQAKQKSVCLFSLSRIYCFVERLMIII